MLGMSAASVLLSLAIFIFSYTSRMFGNLEEDRRNPSIDSLNESRFFYRAQNLCDRLAWHLVQHGKSSY